MSAHAFHVPIEIQNDFALQCREITTTTPTSCLECDKNEQTCFRHRKSVEAPYHNILRTPEPFQIDKTTTTRNILQPPPPPLPRGNISEKESNLRSLLPNLTGSGMDPISLTGLAHLRRLDKHRNRIQCQAEQRLQLVRTCWAVRSRLVQERKRLQHELSNAIRFENQKAFVPLFKAYHTVKQACESYDDAPCAPFPDSGQFGSARGTEPSDFLLQLSSSSQESLVMFLRRLACDSDFLLHRLADLSSKEFDALIRYHQQTDSSILRNNGFSQSVGYKPGVDTQPLEALLDFSRHDVLSLLLQVVGPSHHGAIDARNTGYWARVCAGLLSRQISGADKFVVALLNAWPLPSAAVRKQNLEAWFSNVLRDGQFLLNKPDKYSFSMRAGISQESSADDEHVNAFFVRSMKALLDCLLDQTECAIPKETLQLAKAIVRELQGSPKQYRAAPYFLCTRWLFSSSMIDLIRNPESCGLALSRHIPLNARRKILDEIAFRLQRLAFDAAYTWRHAPPVHPDLLSDMQAVVSLFRPRDIPHDPFPHGKPKLRDSDAIVKNDEVILCASDVLTLVQGLFPERNSGLDPSLLSLDGSTVRSSASSVSGYSLFRNGLRVDTPIPEARLNANSDRSTSHLPRADMKSERTTIPLDDHETSDTSLDEERLSNQLHGACIELNAFVKLGSPSGHCDPFSEAWSSFHISPDDCQQVPDKGRPLIDRTDHGDSAYGEADVTIPKDLVPLMEAIHLLLDRMNNVKKNGVAIHSGTRYNFRSYPDTEAGLPTVLSRALEAVIMDCQQDGDLTGADFYCKAFKRIRSLSRSSNNHGRLLKFLNSLARDLQQSIDRSQSATDRCQAAVDDLMMDNSWQLASLDDMDETLSRFREKMWYISSVRFSSHYEELNRIVSALRIMGIPAVDYSERPQPPLRHRATRGDLHLKTESVVLELLSAPPIHGGPNKLSDIQIALTSEWIKAHGIENVCEGEERIHKFCQELRKCANLLVGDSLLGYPVLWSCDLFRDVSTHDYYHNGSASTMSRASMMHEQIRNLYEPLPPPSRMSRLSHARSSIRTSSPFGSPQELGFSMSGSPLQDRLGSCSPTLTNTTSSTLWSSFSNGAGTPSSVTSAASHFDGRPLSDRSSYGSLNSRHQCSREFLDHLKQNLLSLLLSDLGCLFNAGSETDEAMFGSFNGKFAARASSPWMSDPRLEFPGAEVSATANEPSRVDFLWHAAPPVDTEAMRVHSASVSREWFRQMFRRFELHSSPSAKLHDLWHIQIRLHRHCSKRQFSVGKKTSTETMRNSSETIDTQSYDDDASDSYQGGLETLQATSDDLIDGFRRLFRDTYIRPKALFRDLQYIAALVPAEKLDNDVRSRAFWNATIAAMSIKQEITQSMIQTADAIVSYHTSLRGHSSVSSAAQAERDYATFTSSRPSSATASENISQYTMADAATLWQITAKEGDPVAQRELATMYLTHPETMNRITAPLAKTDDVFKGAAVDPARGRRRSYNKGMGEQHSDGKYDPLTMAVARHWMELAAKGGDELAKNTLKASDEIEKIP